MSQRSLEDAIQAAGSPVELARNSQIGPYVYPVVPAEFTNWRDEQAGWRETCRAVRPVASHDGSLRRGPRRDQAALRPRRQHVRELRVDKAKQFVACNHDGYVIGDAILFFLDENRVRSSAGPRRTTGCSTTARPATTTSAFERDERTAVNPTGRRKLYRFQVQGPTASEVLDEGERRAAAGDQVLQHGRGRRSAATRCARCTTACPARPGWSCSGRGTRPRTSAPRSSRRARTSACGRSARAPTRRTRSSPAGFRARCRPSSRARR